MKTALLFFALALAAHGQDWSSAGGSFGGANILVNPRDSWKTWNRRAPVPADGVWLRRIGTNVFDIKRGGWTDAEGEVIRQEKHLVILQTDSGPIALTNYSGDAVSGRQISVAAVRNGIYHDGDEPLAVWDCGIAYKPTPEEIAAAKAAKEKATADAAAKFAEQKKIAAAHALKANEDAAAKDEAYGLLRMGERYRDGEGVDKDLTKAKDYLQRAMDAGSITAKAALEKLNQP